MRLWVKVRDLDPDDVVEESVLLPYGANERQTEAALSAIGIYCPRGPETIVWGCYPGSVATIFDAYGEPMAALYDENPH